MIVLVHPYNEETEGGRLFRVFRGLWHNSLMKEEYTVPNCIRCGSRDVAECIWGDPDLSYIVPLENKGYKFEFMGCLIDDYKIGEVIEDDGLMDDPDNDNREFNCITCGNEYTWRDWRKKQAG